MGNNIVIVACEGPHDVAFLSKILKADNYKSYENLSLNEYPIPMNSLLLREVEKTNFKELNLHTVRHSLLPGTVLKKESNILFLYALGGDSKVSLRKNILIELLAFLPKEGKIDILNGNTVNLIYFFDADDKGVDLRMQEISKEINEVIKIGDLTNGSIVEHRDLKLGSYIFSNGNNKGKLEDILFPLMKLNNEEIFEDAQNYYNNYLDEARGHRKNRDLKKSVIGITGQLQNSGATNTVTIRHSDYISDDKIVEDANCQAILSFFRKFI
ncbi:hypothetical protein MWU76_15285 [Gelidibacter sp. F2691]|nr:hypothetical protein [Gelidibacter sp. F2691]